MAEGDRAGQVIGRVMPNRFFLKQTVAWHRAKMSTDFRQMFNKNTIEDEGLRQA